MHLLLLDEASAYNLVNRRFDERPRDRLALSVLLAEVRDRFLVVANVPPRPPPASPPMLSGSESARGLYVSTFHDIPRIVIETRQGI